MEVLTLVSWENSLEFCFADMYSSEVWMGLCVERVLQDLYPAFTFRLKLGCKN